MSFGFETSFFKIKMKSSFFLSSAFQFLSWKTWEPFIPSEVPRSVCMTPQKILVSGSNKGNLVFYDLPKERIWTKRLDNYPVYSLVPTSHFTIATTKSYKTFLLDPKGNCFQTFQWPNMTLFQTGTSSGRYVRLASNHWLTCWEKDQIWSLKVPIQSQVLYGKAVDNLIIFLTIDWNLVVGVWKEKTLQNWFTISLYKKSTKNIPTYLDVHKSSESPLRFKLLLGGTTHTFIHELDVLEKNVISSVDVEEYTQNGVFLGKDGWISLQKENKVLIKKNAFTTTSEWEIHLDKNDAFQFSSPALITRDEKKIHIVKLENLSS